MESKHRQGIRVIHLSSSHSGGAGISARRLNSRLNDIGIESHFYAIAQPGYSPCGNEFYINRGLLRRLASGFTTVVSRFVSGLSFFSVLSAPGISTKWILSQSSQPNTIIHLHNWFNLISIKQLQKLIKSKVPLVITLHDQRLMTGGCHTALSCSGFKTGCNNCPELPRFIRVLPRRNQILVNSALKERNPFLRVVSPSYFLQAESSQSFALSTQSVSVVPNILDGEFQQFLKKEFREIDDGIFKVGFASINPLDLLKGGDLIAGLRNLISKNKEKIEVISLSDFKFAQEVFWSQINCLLVPSRGDNSPNVIHEAKALGIPVIANLIGGIPELLSPMHDIGIKDSELTSENLLKAILVMKDKGKSNSAKLKIISEYEKFTSDALERFISIYHSVI
jgi:glycosyltransferase involved in cell wall biosynthesis